MDHSDFKQGDPQKPSFWSLLFTQRMASILLLGFSCGLPLALSVATLQAWLKNINVDLGTIGLFSMVALPYSLKFLWAPLLDRYELNFLGRRRGWLFCLQVLIMVVLTLIAQIDPSKSPWLLAFFAFLLAFFNSTQDLVFDAYRREVLPEEEWGLSFSIYSMGYRLAMVTSGSIALILADHMSWNSVYQWMALFMVLGLLGTLLGKNEIASSRPRDLKEALVGPFQAFFKRPGAVEILIFLLIYKLDAMMTVALQTPFFMELGYTKTQIGALSKGYGTMATLAGSFFGGYLYSKWGLKKSLWFFGITQSLAALSFWALTQVTPTLLMLGIVVSVENFFSGTAMAAFAAFMMWVCDQRYVATQYALLSSFMALSRILAGSASGFLVTALGWQTYYFVCIFVGIPSLFMLKRFSLWEKSAPKPLSPGI